MLKSCSVHLTGISHEEEENGLGLVGKQSECEVYNRRVIVTNTDNRRESVRHEDKKAGGDTTTQS
jgi:hypothetical protein